MKPKNSIHTFTEGLIFGFDVGTGSIGYAVRKKDKFLDVGVLICDSEGSDLSKRRELRRQRRTLRSKKYRRKWFSNQLVILGLLRPSQKQHDPISLRLRALNGEMLAPEELHAALTHLFRRRGYQTPPWAKTEFATKENARPKKDDEEGKIKEAVKEITTKLAGKHPCQFLADEKARVGKSPTTNWARKIYWPREVLQKEFEAIVAAQKKNVPQLAEKKEWLLYGDTKEVKGFHVYFKTTVERNPGVLGLRWPRFDNRDPALDSLQPVDEQGRPLHVVRKNKEPFIKAQWELALMNFRVIELATGKHVAPDSKNIARLREIWESGKRKKKKESASGNDDSGIIKISESILRRWANEFAHQYKLIDGQQPLTPQTGAGRARYSSPTLERIITGERFDPPQPLLRRKGESTEQALNRYLADIKHPLVRHRLVLFQRLLKRLTKQFGSPDMIVLEAVRSLSLGKEKKREHIQRIHDNRKERESIRNELLKDGFNSSKNSILRYRLFKEAKGRCPFCLCPFCLQQVVFKKAEIEHIVPRSQVDCNEYYNLTVAHHECNKKKDNRTPWEVFGGTNDWEAIRKNAEDCFGLGSLKYRLFTNPDAQNLVEEKSDLQHTAYIARVIRGVALLQLGWIGQDGRDPTIEKGNKASSSFQVTNGQLTSRLRAAWGLNQILHPLPPGRRWDELTDEEKQQFTEKNRGDLRHHALDAMVIACTLPWLAHRTHGAKDENGNHGWWTQDKKQRSQAANPVFLKEGQMHQICKTEIENVVIRHHVSRSNHQRAYDTTIYGQPKKIVIKNGRKLREPILNCYVSRKPITALKPKDLKSAKGKSKVFPTLLGDYLALAWETYCESEPEWEKQLKANKDCLPETFQTRLCFSAFQRWREEKAPSFYWPEKVKIPIKRVGYIGVEDDNAVSPASPGTHGFVARGGRAPFREVRLHPSKDGKALVPVFIPSWKEDRPIPLSAIQANSKPVAIIRRGQTVEIVNSPGRNTPNGKYRITSTMRANIQLLPLHLADRKESLKASGYLENGVNISWSSFIKAAGYELPHSPSS